MRSAVVCAAVIVCECVCEKDKEGQHSFKGNLHETCAAGDEDVFGRVIGLSRDGGATVRHDEAFGGWRRVCGCSRGVKGAGYMSEELGGRQDWRSRPPTRPPQSACIPALTEREQERDRGYGTRPCCCGYCIWGWARRQARTLGRVKAKGSLI